MILLIRGGSISAGYGCLNPYPEIVKTHFENSITIYNKSNNRDTSFDAIETFKDDIAPYKPDILTLHFGIDDAYHPVFRSEFKENIVQTIRVSRQFFKPKIVLMTSHSFENPIFMDEVYIYYRALREIAVDMDCFLLPIHIIWDGLINDNEYRHSDLVQNDVRFPNEAGHLIYANALINLIHQIKK